MITEGFGRTSYEVMRSVKREIDLVRRSIVEYVRRTKFRMGEEVGDVKGFLLWYFVVSNERPDHLMEGDHSSNDLFLIFFT
jgi:hypothetical protein